MAIVGVMRCELMDESAHPDGGSATCVHVLPSSCDIDRLPFAGVAPTAALDDWMYPATIVAGPAPLRATARPLPRNPPASFVHTTPKSSDRYTPPSPSVGSVPTSLVTSYAATYIRPGMSGSYAMPSMPHASRPVIAIATRRA